MGVNMESRVVNFNEKPDHPTQPGNPNLALASMGVYVFNTRFLYETIGADADDKNSSHDFGKGHHPGIWSPITTGVFAQSFEESCCKI